MATTETLHYCNFVSDKGNLPLGYYTEAAYQKALSVGYSIGTTHELRSVTKYTTVVTLQPSDAGTLRNNSAVRYGAATPQGTVYWDAIEGPTITLNSYKYGASTPTVYGGNASYPDCFRVAASRAVIFSPADAKHRRSGNYIFEEGNYAAQVSYAASGSEYDATKIVYDNSANYIYFGRDVTLDKSFVVFAGYFWFLCLVMNEIALPDGATFNNQTRTVADGKTRAYITDVVDYNSGSNASLTTKASTGSLTFPYNKVIRAGLGDYLPDYTQRKVVPITATTDDGNFASLRGLGTLRDGSGTFYPVGSYIDEVLTRRPSLDKYDVRVMLYGFWNIRVTVTVESNGGSGVSAFYFGKGADKFFADADMTAEITAIEPLTKANAVFLGLYATDSTDGAPVVTADGAISADFAPQSAAVLYAQWRVVADVALDPQGGEGGASMISYDSSVGGFILPGGTAPVSAVPTPVIECFRFNGYYTQLSGGVQMIDSSGTLLPSLIAAGEDAPSVLYAQWERVSYKMTLAAQGGEGGDAAIFCDGVTAAFYRDPLLENVLDFLDVPTRLGYSLLGFFTAESGGDKAVDGDGSFLLPAFSESGTLYAQWTAQTFTLSFNAAGGAVSPDSKAVTFGQPVGALPTPTPSPNASLASFIGWRVGRGLITEASVWTEAGDATAFAQWQTAFGYVEDFFDIASTALVPVSSSSGDTLRRVAVSHGGKYEGGVTDSGGIWRNPSVTYLVVADTTIMVQLGKAWKPLDAAGKEVKPGSSSVAVSGYMITSVEIETALGSFPRVTVSAVANEGANAVNNFAVNANRFTFSVPVVARARAQNLMNAVTGGGYLHRCVLTATCDAVVCEERLMPCASDIVNGRFELSADTLAANMEAAPVGGGGFSVVGVPKTYADTDYTRYSVQMRKEMV